MKRLFLSVVLALICVAPAANAADSPEFNAKTTADLVELCSAPLDAMFYQASMAYCLGFIDAAHDYHSVITSGDLLRPIACPGPGVTRQEMIDVFLAWAAKNPGLLKGEGPIHGLMRAASDKWSCS